MNSEVAWVDLLTRSVVSSHLSDHPEHPYGHVIEKERLPVRRPSLPDHSHPPRERWLSCGCSRPPTGKLRLLCGQRLVFRSAVPAAFLQTVCRQGRGKPRAWVDLALDCCVPAFKHAGMNKCLVAHLAPLCVCVCV